MDGSYAGVRGRVIKLGSLREQRRSARVFACDPDDGRPAMAVADFSRVWDGYILTVCREEKP